MGEQAEATLGDNSDCVLSTMINMLWAQSVEKRHLINIVG